MIKNLLEEVSKIKLVKHLLEYLKNLIFTIEVVLQDLCIQSDTHLLKTTMSQTHH